MTITFGNATVQRLYFERQLAERLHHLRFYKITIGSILAFEPYTTGFPSLSVVALPGSVDIILRDEGVKPNSMKSSASACMSSSKRGRLLMASPVVCGRRA